ELIELPELKRARADVSVGVLSSCERPASALHFARYLSARDKGLRVFKEKGYKPADGDLWADKPVLTLYVGAMLTPAINETINEFARREGLEVGPNIKVVPDGCGILVARMKAGKRPDLYFACDATFLDQVKDLFEDEVPVSTNRLVILVHKGN